MTKGKHIHNIQNSSVCDFYWPERNMASIKRFSIILFLRNRCYFVYAYVDRCFAGFIDCNFFIFFLSIHNLNFFSCLPFSLFDYRFHYHVLWCYYRHIVQIVGNTPIKYVLSAVAQIVSFVFLSIGVLSKPDLLVRTLGENNDLFRSAIHQKQ